MSSQSLKSEEILSLLKKTFQHYVCLSGSPSSEFLTHSKFRKFLGDAQLLNRQITPQQMELAITRERSRSKSITFEAFCETLATLSKELYPEDEFSSLFMMLDNHIIPLFVSLQQSGEIINFIAVDNMVDQECLKYLHACLPALRDLYITKLPWELSSSEDWEKIRSRSKSTLHRWLYQFNIFPDLINANLAYKIWNDVIEFTMSALLQFEDLGSVFTFKKFVLFLLRCALLADFSGKMLSSSEKLCKFFERLDCVKSFPGLTKGDHSQNLASLFSQKVKTMTRNLRRDESSINTSDQTQMILENYLEKLQEIFKHYCKWGDHTNARRLSCSQFIRLMKDACIINSFDKLSLKPEEVTLMYTKVTNQKKSQVPKNENDSNKMNFSQFIKALELVSHKKNMEMPFEQALCSLIENHILLLDANSPGRDAYLKDLLHIIKEESLSNLIISLQRTLRPYAKHYMDTKGRIGFQSFISFCSDFSVFPDIISKPKLTNIFYLLADTYARNFLALTGTQSLSKKQKKENFPDQEYIDFDLLIDAIALAALESNIPEVSPSEKIVGALERIVRSKGSAVVPLKTGYTRSSELEKSDYMTLIREKPKITVSEKRGFVDMLNNRG